MRFLATVGALALAWLTWKAIEDVIASRAGTREFDATRRRR